MAEETQSATTRPPLFIYMDDWPYARGSGAHLRFHSNVAAWADAGWDVTVVRVAGESTPPPEWTGVQMEEVLSDGPLMSLGGKLQYRFGYAGEHACAYYFAKHRAIRAAVQERQRRAPGALHQLEGDSLANVVPFLPGLNSIFSHHDLSTQALRAIHRMTAELESRKLNSAERREAHFVAEAELRICKASRLILCISDYDREVLAQRFGLTHAVYFPMSVTPEDALPPGDRQANILTLLHVGKINHLPTYRSLEHLLGEVFPRLRPETLARIRLRVVGKLEEADPKCQRILALREPYRDQVIFTGFVQDLPAEYAQADLQVVASTEVSGLRTRIVESMAWGIPVLSTPVAARGIGGLEPGRNILLAENAEAFAATLDQLANNKNSLLTTAAAGRDLYLKRNSRTAVAAMIRELAGIHFPSLMVR